MTFPINVGSVSACAEPESAVAERRRIERVKLADRGPLGSEMVGAALYPSSSDVSGLSTVWLGSCYVYPDGSMEGSLTPRRGNGGGGRPKPDVEKRAREIGWMVGDSDRGRKIAEWEDAERQRRAERANIERAEQRAKVCVRRFVRHHDCRRLLTFTNGDAQGRGWESRKAALDDVAGFVKNHRKELFGDHPMILIAEMGGKGGRWHVHAAMPARGWIDYSWIICRYSAYMEAIGWHSATGTHRFHAGDEGGKHRGAFKSARWAARYLVKYIVKGFQDEECCKGEHRYRVAGGKLPTAWRATAACYEVFRVLLTIGQGDAVARFAPSTGCFRCYSFDMDSGTPPPDCLAGAFLDLR